MPNTPTTSTFTLNIETPDGNILKDAKINNIKLRAEDGALQVFAHHISFMTSIQYSPIETTDDKGKTTTYLLRNGIFHFNNESNSAHLVAEYCQLKSSIDPETTKDYLSYIQEKLANKEDLSEIQLVYLENEKFAVENMLKD